ncbi:Hypothetical protein BROD_1591 [Brucella sp. NF 2653]|nr:Hypothetical protein BROD_1591 [Brucella sp. NF 2653]
MAFSLHKLRFARSLIGRAASGVNRPCRADRGDISRVIAARNAPLCGDNLSRRWQKCDVALSQRRLSHPILKGQQTGEAETIASNAAKLLKSFIICQLPLHLASFFAAFFRPEWHEKT